MIQQFAHEIWIADGPNVVAMMGFHYPTRMVVVRLSGTDLFICSPITLTEELRREIDALGEVRYLVAPNSLHHLFISDWKNIYPSAKVFGAPGLRAKRPDLIFDHELDDVPIPEWSSDIAQILVKGKRDNNRSRLFSLSERDYDIH